MKIPQKSLSILIFLLSMTLVAQKACDNAKETPLEDLNSLAIKKCVVTSKSVYKEDKNTKKVRQIQVKRTSFKKRFFTKRKKEEVTSLVSNINGFGVEKASIKTNNNLLKKETITLSEEELSSIVYSFNEVDEVPLFIECKELQKSQHKNCFNYQITNFITGNIEYPEDAYDEELKGIVSVKFTINNNGKINDLTVSQTGKGDVLKQAVTKLINRLPKFIPAKKQSQNVATKYEFSLNFSF